VIQRSPHHLKRAVHGGTLAIALSVAAVFAQQQVNLQTNARVNTGMGPVNTRAGGELYGNNTSTGTVRYARQVGYLPSEVRYAQMRSGALPSEIRMGAAAQGPLSPTGAVGYIPAQSELQKAVKAAPPVLWGPAYGPKPAAAPSGTPAPVWSPQLNAASIHYASSASQAAPSPYYLAATPLNSTPLNATAINAAPVSAQRPISYRAEDLFPAQGPTLPAGSIRYSDLAPVTPPSQAP
jgi:hypothetical protein